MDVSTSLKRKTTSTIRTGSKGSNIPNIEWMIRWIQEIGLVGQEFARQHGMQVPNLPSNKYGTMQFHQQSEEQGSKEEEGSDEDNEDDDEEEENVEQDSQEKDDDYEAAFQPQ